MKRKTLLLFILLSLFCLHVCAQTDTVGVADSAARATPLRSIHHHKPFNGTLKHGLPLVAASALSINVDDNIRELRFTGAHSFHTKVDNVSQFIPLATQLSLRTVGYRGRSDTWGKMLLSDALGMGLMAGFVYVGKTTFARLRPDMTAANSYPSGHTATAFASATLLHLEYGERCPWISVAGYTMASLTGLSRIANNRHWASDVLCGAAVGIFAAEMGYWISDLLFRSPTGYNYSITQRQEGTLQSAAITVAAGNRHIRQLIHEGNTVVERADAFGVTLAASCHPSFARWMRFGTLLNVSTEKLHLRDGGRPAKNYVAPAISVGLSVGAHWRPWSSASVWGAFVPSVLIPTDFTREEGETEEMSFELHRRSGFQPIFRVGMAQELTNRMGVEVFVGYQLGRAQYHLHKKVRSQTIVLDKTSAPYRGWDLGIGLQLYPFRD